MMTTSRPIDAKRAALLVMDYQNGIIGMIEDAGELVTRARTAIDTVRAKGGTIAYVRVAFTAEEIEAVPERNKGFSALKSSGRRFGADDQITAIDARLAPSEGDIVVRKTRVGAFSTTGLETQLRERGIDTLILAGISTSGVVLSTIRDAADRDYRLIVLADACVDPSPAVHTCLIDEVFPRQADLMNVRELEAALR